MASIINEPGGRKRIDFYDADGARKRIRIGKASQKSAAKFATRIGNLLQAIKRSEPIDDDTAAWLAEIPTASYRKLARVGLITGDRPRAATLAVLMKEFFAALTIKSTTRITYRQTEAELVEHFGKARILATIGPADAEKFRQMMVKRKLALATISKRIKTARQMFAAAVTWEMIDKNPFAKVKAGGETNPARLRFISVDVARKVLDNCPDIQWKLIFALSRWGGLRCPSEHLSLRWADIHWDQGRMTVHGKMDRDRIVPIFPEILPLLLEAHEKAEEGAEFVITHRRNAATNLRTNLLRIIRRAGLVPWPRPFHNLRATRQTELVETFPVHVVCAWIGNSEAIARKHYLQVRNEHFEQAINPALNPALRAVTGSDMEQHGETSKPTADVKKRGPEQQDRAGSDPDGIRTNSKSRRKTGRGDENGAKSGATDNVSDEFRMAEALRKIRAAHRQMAAAERGGR